MSRQDLISPNHGCRHEGKRFQSLFISSLMTAAQEFINTAVCFSQLRIPTCYDKPGTSQLVQSTSVR